MGKDLGSYLERLGDRLGSVFNDTHGDVASQEARELIGYVKQAMEEWNRAEEFFENVSEPDLVDYAIYRVEASKRRYMYLLKQAKEKGVKVDCC